MFKRLGKEFKQPTPAWLFTFFIAFLTFLFTVAVWSLDVAFSAYVVMAQNPGSKIIMGNPIIPGVDPFIVYHYALYLILACFLFLIGICSYLFQKSKP